MSETEARKSPQKDVVKTIGWATLFLFFLFFFTLSKLPETKITNLIQGYLQVTLDPYGIYVTDHGREFSVWRGFRLKLIQPSFELADQTRVDFDEITLAPSFLSLFKGQLGATLILKQGNSEIKATGSGNSGKISTWIQLDQVDLGKLGLLAYAAGLKGSMRVDGEAQIEGPLTDLPSLTGLINLKISKMHLDEQSVMGFQLPHLSVSEGVIEIPLEKGKFLMKNVRFGKAKQKSGNTAPEDDLQLTLTGDLQLNRFLNASILNLRTVFGLSDKTKASLSFLDTILSSAKQKDGTYAYRITGSVGAPFPLPDPK